MGLPQREPVMSARKVNEAPSGAAATATVWAIFMRQTMPMAELTATMP